MATNTKETFFDIEQQKKEKRAPVNHEEVLQQQREKQKPILQALAAPVESLIATLPAGFIKPEPRVGEVFLMGRTNMPALFWTLRHESDTANVDLPYSRKFVITLISYQRFPFAKPEPRYVVDSFTDLMTYDELETKFNAWQKQFNSSAVLPDSGAIFRALGEAVAGD